MLKELSIRNLAVIDALRIEFGAGFHVLTGETGAGKSVLIESIGLVLGGRPRGPVLRDGASEAVIEASFDVSRLPETLSVLREEGLLSPDDESEAVLRRHIQADGKGRAFVNGNRVTLSVLQRLGEGLVDYTGQHEQTRLLDSGRDRELLDGFLPDPLLLADYRARHAETRDVADRIAALERSLLEKNERLEWIRYQLKELRELRVASAEEEAELRARRESLKHAAAIAGFAGLADEALVSGERSCLGVLNLLQRELERKPALGAIFPAAAESLSELKARIEDFAFELAKAASRAERDGGDLSPEAIEERLFHLEKLKRKFGPEIADVLAKRDELTAEMNDLENADSRLDELKRRRDTVFAALREAAEKLTRAREAAAKRLEKDVLGELADLRMASARFAVEVKPIGPVQELESYAADGADAVTFLLAPNPGLALKPLAKIASGGEASRIFLAIKRVLTRSRPAGLLIFDEIDAGLSGAAVELTGLKLKDLAARFQVLCITHHAQIASLSDRHYLVSKSVTRGKTLSQARLLAGEERAQELARLMGGVKISEKNLAFAREMLKGKTASA